MNPNPFMPSAPPRLVAAALVFALAAAPASAQSAATTCQPDWIPTFGALPGVGHFVEALAVYDDGTGAALYAAGEFSAAGSVPASRIAKWDGSTWSALGSGITDTTFVPNVLDLAVYDDGTGPALFAAGSFTHAGGIPASGVARWDGTTWSSVGFPGSSVSAIEVYDDGSGPALHTGGLRWNGSTWQTIPGLLSGVIYALQVFDDGTGMALYAGGSFSSVGGVPMTARVVRYAGGNWSAVSTGVPSTVLKFVVHDDGTGPALYAGGLFVDPVRWNGSTWTLIPGSGLSEIRSLGTFDDGGGPQLYVGGTDAAASTSTSGARRWNGSVWSTPGADVLGSVYAFQAFDDGSGPALYTGGLFTRVGDVSAGCVARWNGSAWSGAGTGQAIAGRVRALATQEEATGNALYAAMQWSTGSGSASRVSRWDGATWSDLGETMNGIAYALEFVDLGAGPELYLGGSFTQIGATAANRVARWTGAGWVPLGNGILPTTQSPFPYVRDLLAFDDGTGVALYATGCFRDAGGPANNVAKWNGSVWSPLAGGLGSCGFTLAVFDPGTGPRLYAGGAFNSAGGVTVNKIARWTGVGWAGLGGGLGSSNLNDVESLVTFDDGTGDALYVSGTFPSAGGITVNNVARWSGTSWSALGPGIGWTYYHDVLELTVFDDGNGPALYAAGDWARGGAVPAGNVARWDPQTGWSPLGAGVSHEVHAMATFDDGGGDGPALYFGGNFSVAFDSGDAFLARWQPCPGAVIETFCAGDGSGTACPCVNTGASGHGCANSLFADGARLATSGSAHVGLDTLRLVGTGMPDSSALYFQGTTGSAGGAGVVFGDGLRCAAGAVIRLGVVTNAGNASQYPRAGDPSVSVRGGCAPGDVRTYQTWYRNAASFCTSATFNLTNGSRITWGP